MSAPRLTLSPGPSPVKPAHAFKLKAQPSESTLKALDISGRGNGDRCSSAQATSSAPATQKFNIEKLRPKTSTPGGRKPSQGGASAPRVAVNAVIPSRGGTAATRPRTGGAARRRVAASASATMPPVNPKLSGPRSDYIASDRVFRDAQPSWQRRMERIRGLRYRNHPGTLHTQPVSPAARGRVAAAAASPTNSVSNAATPTASELRGGHAGGSRRAGFGAADTADSARSLPPTDMWQDDVPAVATGLSSVLSQLDSSTVAVLSGHFPAELTHQYPRLAPASDKVVHADLARADGFGEVYPSPFVGAPSATVGASGEFKGIKARQTWKGMHEAFGAHATAAGMASLVQAASSPSKRAELEDEHRRWEVRQARARAFEASLEAGDPQSLKTTYMLSRLHQSQREFDDAWMSAAYADGGTRDAITNYAPIPLADRLAKRKANAGASKLDLLKSIVGISGVSDGPTTGLSKLLGKIGMEDVRNSPFLSLPERLRRRMDNVAEQKEAERKAVAAAKRRSMMDNMKTADSFVLNFEFETPEKKVEPEPEAEDSDASSVHDVWKDHKRMPGTSKFRTDGDSGDGDDADDLAAVGRGEREDDNELRAYFGSTAKSELHATYRSLVRRNSALLDMPAARVVDPLPKKAGSRPVTATAKRPPVPRAKAQPTITVPQSAAGTVAFEKQHGMWEDPERTRRREELLRSASNKSLGLTALGVTNVDDPDDLVGADDDDDDDDADSLDTADAFDVVSSSSSSSGSSAGASDADSDSDASQASDGMTMTKAERDARREVRFLKSALASRTLVSATVDGAPPGSPDESDVKSELRRLRRQASKAHRLSVKLARSRLPPGRRTTADPDKVNPVIAAHYADKFKGSQSVLHSYLRYCRDHGVAPEAFVLRKSRSTTLNLGHFSLGSSRARALATALGALPLLQHLNLEDNRLTDDDLALLLEALHDHPSLLSLDISSNTPGKTALPHLCKLVRHSLTLTRLIVSRCKLSNLAVQNLSSALQHNDSVTLLDLSHNTISAAGGEALGRVLMSTDVEELDVSWNQLGDLGVEAMSTSLGDNNGPLRWLDLSWNGISSTGASFLGAMLSTNTSLAHLDLSNNNIDPRGAMVLSDGIDRNTTVLSLQLNSNPLGSDGCRAIMRAMRKARDKPRSIGLMHCTMQSAMVFDPNAPAGTYNLDLADPYQRLVAQELVRLAESSQDVHFQGARWVPPGARPPAQPIGTPIDMCIKVPDTAPGTGGASSSLSKTGSSKEVSRGASSSTLPAVGRPPATATGVGGATSAPHSAAVAGAGASAGAARRKRPQVVFLKMHRELAKVSFTKELWRALRGNLTDVADWIADQNKRGARAAKDGLGRKARRHGGIVKAFFTPVDIDQQRDKLWQKREAARLKKEADLAAAIAADAAARNKKLTKKKTFEKSQMDLLAERNKEMSMSGVGLTNKNTFDKRREMAKRRWEDEVCEEGQAEGVVWWEPPSEGLFQVKVRVSQESKDQKEPEKKGAEVQSLMHLLHDSRSAGQLQSHDRLKLLELASMDMAIASTDAARLMQMDLLKKSSSGQRVHAMSRLLFRLVDPGHAMRLLDQNLTEKEKREVQATLGQAFRLLIGQATGHYTLNLADPQDRDVLIRLLAVNKEERNWLRMRYPKLDTSQKGNGHRFRNERMNGVPVTVTPKEFEQIPPSGILEFDFVSCRRPSSRAKTVHSLAFSRILRRAGVYTLLRNMGITLGAGPDDDEDDGGGHGASDDDGDAAGDGASAGGAGKDDKSDAGGAGAGAGAGGSGSRSPVVARRRPVAAGSRSPAASPSRRRRRGSKVSRPKTPEYKPPPPSSYFAGPPYHLNPLTETPNEWPLPLYEGYCKVKRRRVRLRQAADVSAARKASKGKGGRVGSAGGNRENEFGWLKKDVQKDSKYDVHAEAKEFDPSDFPEVFARAKVLPEPRASEEHCTQAAYVLTDLIALCSTVWISSRQLSDLVRMFPRTLPGLRVELVVSLFNRVVDLSGVHRVLFALTMPERRTVRHRLGWLNLWDPMMPDGKYRLDLSVWEERVVAHAITQLAVSEPGESWVDTSFNSIPGWRLPRMWLQSMPQTGLLEVTYTSLEPSCEPVWAERKRQCRKVLTYC